MIKKRILILENDYMVETLILYLEHFVNWKLAEITYIGPGDDIHGRPLSEYIPSNFDGYFLHNSLIHPNIIQRLLNSPGDKIVALRRTIRRDETFISERLRYYGDTGEFNTENFESVLRELGVLKR